MEEKRVSPVKAIRLKCLDCCCGSSHEVKQCPATNCPLHPFRDGHNPNIAKRELSEAQMAAAKARIAQVNRNRKRNGSEIRTDECKDTARKK